MANCEDLITTDDLASAKVYANKMTEFVESSNNTMTTPEGEDKLTITGMGDIAKETVSLAVSSAGYTIVGDFSDSSKVTIASDNQVYTSKLVSGSEDALWRTNQVLPYTPTGADPTSGAESGKWVVVAQGELKSIARSLNALNTQVIYSTDTATALDDVLYIHDSSKQITYAKPANVDAGEVIVSVVDGILTTNADSYALKSINKSGIIFETIADIDSGNSIGGKVSLIIGDTVIANDYAAGNNSGVLFFKVVVGGTGVDDSGKYIDLSSGLQLEQNLRLPCDPRAWGAIGSDDIANATSDTLGIQRAINYGKTHINQGKYYLNDTTTIYNSYGVTSDADAVLEYSNITGSCVLIGNGTTEVPETHIDLNIIDNSSGRESTYTVSCKKVSKSTLDISVIPSSGYLSNYTGLTDSEILDLKFGVQIGNTSYTNDFIGKLFKSTLEISSADNSVIAPAVIWANERRTAVNLISGSNIIGEGVQIVPGLDYGIYSSAADITHVQIFGVYFDGNTSLQSVIPTGHSIYFEGNLRRSTISGCRFFITAKRPITVLGTLESSTISAGNVFDNGDSADLGYGDILLGSSTGSVITGNTHFRDNLAEKTGSGRTQPDQPPITINGIGSEFDEPTIISNNSLQGVNNYSDSAYPSVSSILTKANHKRIGNNNAFECRYTDNQELLCKQLTLTQVQLDALNTGEFYTTSLVTLGISGDARGYIKTTRLQSTTNLSYTEYAKQEIITDINQLGYARTQNNGVWSSWKSTF